MAVNDPLGDMLTRIRNAQMRKRGKVSTPGSSLRKKVLDVLESEGYIRGYSTTDFGNGRSEFEIELKYFDNEPVIRKLERVSKPGRRVYATVDAMPRVANGLGVAIVSTPKGVMADHAARESQRRRRSPLHRLLTGVAKIGIEPCLVLARSPWSFRPASPPSWRVRPSPSRARRANSSSPRLTRCR